MADYQRQVNQLQLVLDGLPAPPPTTQDRLLVVSVTGLVTYSTCPKRYYWTAVDPLPRRPSSAARRGTEIHRRIELHNVGAVPLQDFDPAGFDGVPDSDPEEPTGPDPFETFLHSRFGDERPRFVEIPFDLHIDGDARVRGRIDAIYEWEPGSWEIVDFKSGRPPGNPAARLQLEAYALAVHDVGLAPTIPDRVAVTFAYLGDGLTEVREEVDGPWLEQARNRLAEVIGSIRAEKWTARPGRACRHCDFLRFCPAGRSWLADAE